VCVCVCHVMSCHVISVFVCDVAVNNVQVSPKQLLGATELQQHVCDPVKDSWEYVGGRGQLDNTQSPRHSPKTVEHSDYSHDRGCNPSSDSHHLHHRNRDELTKTGLQYPRSVAAHPYNDQINRVGIDKHSEPKYHQYRRVQSAWQQMHDRGQQTICSNLHRQHSHQMVSFSF